MEPFQSDKAHNKKFQLHNLEDLTKEELIAKIKALESHNLQLKNIITKSNAINSKTSQKRPRKPFDFSTCNFRHILLKFMYLGWDYQGYATQEDTTNTIEHHIFEALIKTCLISERSTSNYHRCGRTDKGVSSFGQVISIDIRSKLPKEQQDNVTCEIKYCSVLNRVLPDTIRCIAWCPVNSDFSARFDCKIRTYKYFFPKGNLDIEKMNIAGMYLLGTHDFRNFCKMDVGNGVIKFVRNIVSIEMQPCEEADKNEEYSMYVLTIKGQAFLWHQIRCIMGVLFLIGQGKESPEVIQELLNIETNSRKPDYNMASEVPLNLYECDYGTDMEWHYDMSSLHLVIQNLQTMWTITSVKSTMLKCMLGDLQNIQNKNEVDFMESHCTNCLINGVKAKKYVPLLQRQRCESLENRIEHYIKRQKLDKLQEAVKNAD